MKKLLSLFCATLASLAISAQTNPMKGYIITNDKDTIYGTIDFRTNELNSKQCSFMADGKKDYETYMPGEIEGYRFSDNGKFYVTRNFEDRGLFFAEFIVKGQMNLYRYQDTWNDIFYFETDEGKVIPYENDFRTLTRDDVSKRRESMKKAQQLYSEVSRSQQAREDIKPGQMGLERFIELVEDYHADVCTSGEDCIVFQYDPKSDKSKMSFEVFAGGGYGIWNKDFMADYYSYLDVNSSFVWTAGVGLNIDASRRIKNMLIQLSLSYTNQATDGKSFGGIKRDVKANEIALGFGALFRFGKDYKPKYTVKVGWMPTYYWVKNESDLKYISYNQNKMTYFTDQQLHMVGAYVGAGYELPMDKHALLLNVEYRTGFGFGVHRILGTVGFRF